VNTGGSCASQGAWTGRAIEQSRLILTTAEQLKSDPDCKALVDAIEKIDTKAIFDGMARDEGIADGPGAKYETLPSDLMALRAVLLKDPGNEALTSRLSPILAKSTVDLAANSASLLGPISQKELAGIQVRMKRAVGVGGLFSPPYSPPYPRTGSACRNPRTPIPLSPSFPPRSG
jgi:hypothetical protein